MNQLAIDHSSSRRTLVTSAARITAAGTLSGLFGVSIGRSRNAAARDDRQDRSQTSNPGDAAALTILLQIERRQIALYTEYIRRFGLDESTSGDRPTLGHTDIHLILRQEHRHAAELEGALVAAGGDPARPAQLAPAFADEAAFMRLAAEIEAEAVAAYTGAVPTLTDPESLALGIGILAVEARQAAVIGARAGVAVLADDFQTALSREDLTAFLAPDSNEGESPLLTVED